MPPIMGVGAFIMAEMIGVSYTKIATSAILPAVVYYVAIFLVVHFVAKRKALEPKSVGLKYTSSPIMPRLYQILPIIVVVVMIFIGFSLTSAALYGTLAAIVINLVSKSIRLRPKQFLDTMLDGIKQASMIALPTAACGVMIGIVVRSGVANKLTRIIAAVGGSNIAVALIIAMGGCLLLGMALPTVAAYLISNILFVPTIVALGVPVFPANMFIFYFGVIAQITPPVCLASFTAAGIAGADSWKTGWKAFTYALVSFLVPYVFVFSPSILLEGAVVDAVITTVVLIIGVLFLSCAVSGYCFGALRALFRAVLAFAAILTIVPERISTISGIVIGVAMLVICFLLSKRVKAGAAARG
jgi:TRAP transporter 4TM/12TM fusion protein